MEENKGTRGGRKPGIRERAALLLGLPGESAGLPRLELTGDRSLYLESYRDILAYGREELHVDGGQWVLRVKGRELEITAMRPGQLRVAGPIDGVELV